jgi:glycosyltransferase involved in cell wall biosynthesis
MSSPGNRLGSMLAREATGVSIGEMRPSGMQGKQQGSAGRRILFVMTTNYPPELTGGVESTTHELCLMLGLRGWSASVFSGSRRIGWFAWRARANRMLGHSPVSRDTGQGYPVYRSRRPLDAIDEICRDFAPEVAIVQLGRLVPLARAFSVRRVPTIVFLHNLNFAQMGGEFFQHPLVRYATVSQFMASALEAKLGVRPSVILPPILRERYATTPTGKVVTFVNPHPVKGIEIALELARRRPDIPFEFVESWPLRKNERKNLTAALANLPNVRLTERTEDMRTVYSRSRILLAPSQWEEPWGRVVSEAQVSGIPAVASRIGGLPEAVGQGGLLVEAHTDIDAWTAALAQVWDNDATRAELSRRARAHAERTEIQLETVLSQFVALVVDSIRSCRG